MDSLDDYMYGMSLLLDSHHQQSDGSCDTRSWVATRRLSLPGRISPLFAGVLHRSPIYYLSTTVFFSFKLWKDKHKLWKTFLECMR